MVVFSICCLVILGLVGLEALLYTIWRRWHNFSSQMLKKNHHSLLVSCYFISTSLWRYLWFCTLTMSTFYYNSDAVSFSSWCILFKVLAFNANICIVLFDVSRFCLSLSSEADFSNTGTRALASIERTLFYPRKDRWGLVIWFGWDSW